MENQLTFKRQEVIKLLEHSKSVDKHPKFYDEIGGAYGVIIVGDHGVYLMPCATPTLKGENGGNVVVYAEECNPETMEFEDWWEVKGNTFGGDDGVDFFPGEDIEEILDSNPDSDLVIIFDSDSYTITVSTPTVEIAQ